MNITFLIVFFPLQMSLIVEEILGQFRSRLDVPLGILLNQKNDQMLMLLNACAQAAATLLLA
jgi:hypothetical protein